MEASKWRTLKVILSYIVLKCLEQYNIKIIIVIVKDTNKDISFLTQNQKIENSLHKQL